MTTEMSLAAGVVTGSSPDLRVMIAILRWRRPRDGPRQFRLHDGARAPRTPTAAAPEESRDLPMIEHVRRGSQGEMGRGGGAWGHRDRRAPEGHGLTGAAVGLQ